MYEKFWQIRASGPELEANFDVTKTYAFEGIEHEPYKYL